MSKHILDFVEWFTSKQKSKRSFLSLRDILAWVEFMNSVLSKHSLETINLSMIYEAYLHGACLVLLDGLAVISPLNSSQLKQESIQFLLSTLTIFFDNFHL
jgi:midasin (ATPase involved in ribosome maturation)